MQQNELHNKRTSTHFSPFWGFERKLHMIRQPSPIRYGIIKYKNDENELLYSSMDLSIQHTHDQIASFVSYSRKLEKKTQNQKQRYPVTRSLLQIGAKEIYSVIRQENQSKHHQLLLKQNHRYETRQQEDEQVSLEIQ